MAKTQLKKKKIREGINKGNHSMNMGKVAMSHVFVIPKTAVSVESV